MKPCKIRFYQKFSAYICHVTMMEKNALVIKQESTDDDISSFALEEMDTVYVN